MWADIYSFIIASIVCILEYRGGGGIGMSTTIM